MASGHSSDNIHDKVTALSKVFSHLEKDVIYTVLRDCKLDCNQASNILAEMSGSGLASKVTMTRNPRNDNNTTAHNIGLANGAFDGIIGFIKKGYKILILMRGLPGSGKTTLAMQLLQFSLGNVNKDEFIFSADQYFYKSGTYIYNFHEIEDAHQWNQKRCFSNIKKGVSPIIIDNTNLQAWEMKVYCVMAVQFGYIIEIVLPTTPWAFTPKVLAQKNEHGVEKQKIKEMLERFEKNVTVKYLFDEFKLKYPHTMPQFRKYPALPMTPQPTSQINVPAWSDAWKAPQREYGSPEKKKPQLPIEYVHRIDVKRDTASPKKQQTTDVDQILNMNNEPKPSNANTSDLISFINEHKSSAVKEEAKISADPDILAKRLQENNQLMTKMMAFLSQQSTMNVHRSASSDEKIISTMETKMEVDQPANIQNQAAVKKATDKIDGKQVSSSLDGLDVLEKENKLLWEMLNKTQASEPEENLKFGSANLPSLSMTAKGKKEKTPEPATKPSSERKQLEFDRINMFFAKSDDSSNSFEFIENMMASASEQPVKAPVKNTKSSVPRLDPKAWGLSESALVSWDTTASAYEPPSLLNDKSTLIETNDRSTNTTEDDFKLTRGGFDNLGSVTRLTGRGIPINVPKKPSSVSFRRKVTLDKGCMTDEEELLLKLNCEESEHVKKLKEVFTDIPLEDLLDVYEKCDKDFHWTVELISNSPTHLPSATATENLKKKSQSKNSEESLKNKSINFVLNDWNVASPSKVENTREADAEITKKKQEEEEARQLKKHEEVLELKKQMEKAVTIGKEHYSEHVWQLKSAKTGAVPRQQSLTEIETRPDSPELMTVDDDTVYMSDNNSDSDSENDEVTEDLVELNLGSDLVSQLESMFGQLMPGENFKPVVQMPESLARQLHALYLESICRQIENQSEYISSQLKEDEEFAMKLQEEERGAFSGNNMNEIMDEALAKSIYQKDVDQWKNVTPDTLALKLTRQKLHTAFPQIEPKLLDEVLVAHDNNYMQTIEAIMNSMGTPPFSTSSNGNPMEPPISDTTLNEMKKQDHFVNKVTDETDGVVKSAAAYRDDANRHMQKRRELLQLAQDQYQKRSFEVAMYYRHLAQLELKKAEVSNQHATHSFIAENAEKLQQGDTLDLHFLYVKDAMVTLDIFLDYQISNLKTANKPHDHYFVITGRGKRSEHGIARLKPAVMKRLKTRKVHFAWINPGMLRIKVQKNLPMSTDLGKPQAKNK